MISSLAETACPRWRPRYSARSSLPPAALFALVLAASLTAPPRAVGAEYELIDLGTLGGSYSIAGGISDAGVVALGATLPNGFHAARWSDGVLTDLGVPEGWQTSNGVDANATGWIAGIGIGETQGDHAYLWRDGSWLALGATGGLPYSAPAAISDAGLVVGRSYALGSGSPSLAWTWEEGAFTDLPPLPSGSRTAAQAVNAAGDVAGWSDVVEPAAGTHAVLWRERVPLDLGTLPGDDRSQALGLNAAGHACGFSSHPVPPYFTASRAVAWLGGQITPLDPASFASTHATAINDLDEIVGWGAVSLSSSPSSALLWQDGQVTDLDSVIPPESGWNLGAATDINTAGEITGWGIAPNGQIHAFLLRPLSPAAAGDPARLAEVPSIEVWPNPASGPIRIRLDLGGTDAAEVAIYDAAGSLVRRVHAGPLPAGRTDFSWPGTDDAGRPVPAGIYFVGASAGRRQVSTKIVLR